MMRRQTVMLLTGFLMAASLTGCSQAEAAVFLSKAETLENKTVEKEMTETAANDSRVLIAYFSLMGNADYASDVDASTSASIVVDETGRYGTTEYVARQIQAVTEGNLYLIETKEPYSADFDEVVDQNHEEMDRGTLPALRSEPLDMSDYDVIFIGYPVWATDVPQAICSFLGTYDFTGKTIVPFCTHGGYGAGSSYATIAGLCPEAEVMDGLAIDADDVTAAGEQAAEWVNGLDIK